MSGKFRRAIAGVLAAATLGLAACGSPSEQPSDPADPSPAPNPPTAAQPYLFGVGEPLLGSNVRNFDAEKTIRLAGALGAKSYRMWFTATNTFAGWSWGKVMSDESLSALTKNTAAMYRAQAESLKAAGIEEITGMGHFLPRVPSTAGDTGNYVPRRDTAPGSDYMLFLRKVELMWKAVASALPEIAVWEMGNEMNHLPFANYAGVEDATYAELAAINVDYMYYARRGIKAGNGKAIALTPGYAPVPNYTDGGKKVTPDYAIDSVARFFELIYEDIASGEFPAGAEVSRDPDDYFDGAAWHPYDLGAKANTNDPDPATFDVSTWVAANNRVHAVMEANGDGDKEAWLTEFGLTSKEKSLVKTDAEDADITVYGVENKYYKTTQEYEAAQAALVKPYFDAMMSEDMRYVHACHFFRMYGCTVDFSWNGFTVLYYGMFFEPDERLNRGFYPRKKAYALQEIYGGTGDLAEFAEWSDL